MPPTTAGASPEAPSTTRSRPKKPGRNSPSSTKPTWSSSQAGTCASGACPLRFLRQCEGDDLVAAPGVGLGMTAGGDDDVLAALPDIGHRRRLPARRQPAAPQLLARGGVEGAQVVVQGGADEHQARCGG